MMGNYYGHVGGLGLGFGWIFSVLFWTLIIWAIVALVRGLSGHHGHGCCGGHGHDGPKLGNNALDILRERYAKGEITKEQFDKMKQDLQ